MKSIALLQNGEVVQREPSKIICIGRNYVAHIEELNNTVPDAPVIFIKPNSAVSSHILIDAVEEIHYEAELSFLISQGKITALGLGLDLTKRRIQSDLKTKGLPWERAKAFDGSAVFSEFIPFDAEDVINSIRLELRINGELKQYGGYDLMLYKPNDIMDDVSAFLTLVDDDIIMTGTPAGVGKINEGDVFEGKVFTGERLLVSHTWTAKVRKTDLKVGGVK